MENLEFNHEFEMDGMHVCVDIPKKKCNQIYIEGELLGTVWECRKQGVTSFISRDFKLAPYLERIIYEMNLFSRVSL